MARSKDEVESDIGRLFSQEPFHPERVKYSFLKGSIVVLEGLISAGKTTLCSSLHEYLSSIGLEVVWFPEEIPKSLLPLYTRDMSRYAFPFQVIVAQNRKSILARAHQLANQGKIVLVDRCLLGDYTFGLMQKEKGFFTDQEFDSYLEMISGRLPAPSFTVFLDCPPEVAFERMKQRGHQEEIEGYTLDYFRDLDRVYRRVVLSSPHHLQVDWSTTAVQDQKVPYWSCRKFLDRLWEEHLRRIE